jgi:hypothetical protein
MKNHTIGTLAYFDSFAGLIPCKVTEISDELKGDPKFAGRTSSCKVRAKLTTGRGSYRRGETIESSALHIIPREFVSFRKYGARILGGYSWK